MLVPARGNLVSDERTRAIFVLSPKRDFVPHRLHISTNKKKTKKKN